MDHNPYLPPLGSAVPFAAPTRHSGLGIASFAIALTTVLVEFALVMAAGFLEASTPGGIDRNSPVTMLIGMGICGGGVVNLLAIALGIAGLFQSDRKKLFAVLGICIAGALLLGVAGLILLGMAAQQAGR